MDVGMTLLFWFCDKLVCEVGFLCVAYRICQNKYSSINVLMKYKRGVVLPLRALTFSHDKLSDFVPATHPRLSQRKSWQTLSAGLRPLQGANSLPFEKPTGWWKSIWVKPARRSDRTFLRGNLQIAIADLRSGFAPFNHREKIKHAAGISRIWCVRDEKGSTRPRLCFLSVLPLFSSVFTQQLNHHAVCMIRDRQSTLDNDSLYQHRP